MKQNTEIEEAIAKRVEYMREARGLTLREVSKVLGVSYQQYRKYETYENRISISSLDLLATYYEINITRFFKDTEVLDSLSTLQRSIMRDVSKIKNPRRIRYIKDTSTMMVDCEKIENGQA